MHHNDNDGVKQRPPIVCGGAFEPGTSSFLQNNHKSNFGGGILI